MTITEEDMTTLAEDIANFKPGLYRHYRTREYYTALGLVVHHETRCPMVLYVSHSHADDAYGGKNVRPLRGWKTINPADYTICGVICKDSDGWLDMVEIEAGQRIDDAGVKYWDVQRVSRFEYIGPIGTPEPT